MTRDLFDKAFLAAIDRQQEMTPHTPGWKPLIDLVWEELSLRPEARLMTALKLAQDWIEKSEDQTMQQALEIEARCQAHGKEGYNRQYIAACRAVLAALKGEELPQESE